MELNYLSNLSQAEDRILVQTDILSEQTLYEIVKVIFHEKSKWAMVIRSILIIITFHMIKKATAIKTQNGLDTVGHHSNIFHNILKVGQWHILNMLSMFEDNWCLVFWPASLLFTGRRSWDAPAWTLFTRENYVLAVMVISFLSHFL